jgi:hypothetical protein
MAAALSTAALVLIHLALWILILYNLIGMVWFWMRRDKFPIPQRKPVIVLIPIFCFLVTGVIAMIPDVFPDVSLNCLILRIAGSIFFYPAMEVMMLRVFLLFYWVILTKAGAEYYETELAHGATQAGSLNSHKSFMGTAFQRLTRYLLRIDPSLQIPFGRRSHWQLVLVSL